ncbi:hypothetical protein SAMN04490185_3552 [Pseudomonas frederiksbergensis]|uniref:Uncharacterized protein n=1 Tax=Pseudomonas frederiksbergensis TaxID=104087 RepID=A0A1H5AY71_9PSED|nr:hypothetical protein [Pseudomonas frederiksbergensis]SED47419.1 hypothetical protein SAMN04490185_3552 [Pseudomonas frederiksbergensis]
MDKKSLYRKVNTRTWGVWRNEITGHYRHQRNTKNEINNDASRGSMHGTRRHGFDYTPLFRFLLSRVGRQWDEVFSETVARLDRPEPVFWMVALHENQRKAQVCLGESSYFSGLYVDGQGYLRIVNPELKAEHMTPNCHCCTHTFNGIPFGRRKD